jgi:serine/threonine-protein kinase
MPPEQARGEIERVSERSDVFGLGTILCHVLTGHPPYDGADGATLIRAARRADLTAAFARLDGCRGPGPLVALTRRCLATDPADRPPHAGVVAAAVTAYLETELRRAERDLVRFFELSMDLFCIAGLDGYFHRVNANFSRVLGYSTAELVSRPFLDYIHPDDRPATVAVMADMANGVPCVRFCNRYVDAGGSYRWFEWTAKSIPEEGVIFAAARDVTAEKNGDPRPPAGA